MALSHTESKLHKKQKTFQFQFQFQIKIQKGKQARAVDARVVLVVVTVRWCEICLYDIYKNSHTTDLTRELHSGCHSETETAALHSEFSVYDKNRPPYCESQAHRRRTNLFTNLQILQLRLRKRQEDL
jgi:hypothetical protein